MKTPYVVVAGELEGHGLLALGAGVDLAAGGLAEGHLYRHAQVVVHGIVGAVDAAGQMFFPVSAGGHAVKYLGALVEGEEIADAGVPVRPNSGRGVIEDEMIFCRPPA